MELKQIFDSILDTLVIHPVIDGMDHIEDNSIGIVVTSFGPTACLEKVRDFSFWTESRFVGQLLKLLSRDPRVLDSNHLPQIIKWGLSQCVEVRDAVMQIIDVSRNSEGLKFLAEHQENVPWLRDYQEQILASELATNPSLPAVDVQRIQNSAAPEPKGLPSLIFDPQDREERDRAFFYYFFLQVSPALKPEDYQKIVESFHKKFGEPIEGRPFSSWTHAQIENFAAKFSQAVCCIDAKELISLCRRVQPHQVSIVNSSDGQGLPKTEIQDIGDGTEILKITLYGVDRTTIEKAQKSLCEAKSTLPA